MDGLGTGLTTFGPARRSQPAEPVVADPDWVRPADWYELPRPDPSDEALYLLAAVFEDGSNFFTLNWGATGGATFTIDWGDGTTPTTGNTPAIYEHEYDWDDLSEDDEIDLHGQTARQVIVSVTRDNGVGGMLTLKLYYKHSSEVAAQYVCHAWLDAIVASDSMTSARWSYYSAGYAYSNHLEHVAMLTPNIVAMTYSFYFMQRFQSLELLGNGEKVTAWNITFYGCYMLRRLPPLDMRASTNNQQCMSNCYALEAWPKLIGSVDERTLPAGNNVNSVYYMFGYNYRLKGEDMPIMTASASVTQATNMFLYTRSMRNHPPLDAHYWVKLYQMFYASIVEKIWWVRPPNAPTNMYRFCYACTNLVSIEWFDTSNVTDFNGCFRSCSALIELPAFDLSSMTVGTDFAYLCRSLRRSQCHSATVSHSYRNCNLSAAAIDEIFTNLGTASGTQTILVNYNPGSATCDPAIATAKGWTVTT